MQDPYAYPSTNILINNFDIKDQDKLNDVEEVLFKLQADNIPSGNFDYAHLQSIHKHLFGKLYPWAGETRIINIAKGDLFCIHGFIESEINKLLRSLAKENFLTKETSLENFSKRFTHYFVEVNAIHPFREGNGRSTRAFFEQLAYHNNYSIKISKIPKDDFMRGCIESLSLSNLTLEELFLNLFRQYQELNLNK